LTGFKQNRESLRSKWIDRLGEFVDVIKNQCNDNTNLKEQLEDVKAVVNLNQENIQASEVKVHKFKGSLLIIQILTSFTIHVSNLECMTRFSNNLHQVQIYTQSQNIGKANNLKVFGSKKTKGGLKRTATSGKVTYV